MRLLFAYALVLVSRFLKMLDILMHNWHNNFATTKNKVSNFRREISAKDEPTLWQQDQP